MVQLALCFLACQEDEDWLQEQGIIESPGSANPPRVDFGTRSWSDTPLIKREGIALGDIWSIWDSNLADQDRSPSIFGFLEEQYPIFIILDSGRKNNTTWIPALEFIDLAAARSQIPIISIALRDVENAWKFEHADTVRQVQWPESKDSFALDEAVTAFVSTLARAYEGLHEAPKVAVGVLMVSCKGNFLLTRRVRLPSATTRYSTFGGLLQKGEITSDAIQRIGGEHLKLSKKSYALGPLLSCTNSIESSSRHWIDLTFLAIAPKEFKLAWLSERYARGEKDWFPFNEMWDFYSNGCLFEPVANAFEQFCLFCSLGGLSLGSAGRFILSRKKDLQLSDEIILHFNGNPEGLKIPIPSPAGLGHYLAACLQVRAKSPFFFEEKCE